MGSGQQGSRNIYIGLGVYKADEIKVGLGVAV
jgi:hypothetical protein